VPTPVPGASASTVELADWLELFALASADTNSSVQDLVQALRRTGSASELGNADERGADPDRGAEKSEQIAESAFAEIEDRVKACDGKYPFKLGQDYIQLDARGDRTPYVFLLLQSRFARAMREGVDALRAFDLLCAHAASEYLGGADRGVHAIPFGFPRIHLPKNFADAVNDLCKQLGECDGARNRPGIDDQKDGKLDIVVWRNFADGRTGKIIGFGQCATGKSGYGPKLTELQPDVFAKNWLLSAPTVDPVRLFFVPWRVDRLKWDTQANAAGVLFDRCRIVQFMDRAPNDVLSQCARWSESALKSLRSGDSERTKTPKRKSARKRKSA